jgi:hypothetical protein
MCPKASFGFDQIIVYNTQNLLKVRDTFRGNKEWMEHTLQSFPGLHSSQQN